MLIISRFNSNNGIALVAVLAILVVLAILAATFVTFMNIEQKSAETSIAKLQADMCAQAGLEHAKSLLRLDSATQPAWDDKTEFWSDSFIPHSAKDDVVDIDKLTKRKWIYVRDPDGNVVGRYAVLIEDECGKINANVASALSSSQQNEGVAPFEIMLTDGKQRGLPVSVRAGKSIIKYRYGRDGQPGQSGVDDNLTAATYASDEIDNNANGVVDEQNEGIDEPEEYSSVHPMWDDRTFDSVNDVISLIMPGNKLNSANQFMKKYCTVYSKGIDSYWDNEDNKLRHKANINLASKTQIRRLMTRANSEHKFAPSSVDLRQLAANIMDYRDENQVLSTIGGEYGIEAVCFNEVMANDGSFTMEPDHDVPQWGWEDPTEFCHRFGAWYNYWANEDYSFGWKLGYIGSFSGGSRRSFLTNGMTVTMKTVPIKIKEPWKYLKRLKHFNDFNSIMSKMGGWPKDLWKNAFLTLHINKDKIPANYHAYPIAGNSKDTLYVGFNDKKQYDDFVGYSSNTYASVRIETFWHFEDAEYCVFPQQNDYWIFPTTVDKKKVNSPPQNLYYYVYIGEQNFKGNVNTDRGAKGAFKKVYDKLGSSKPWKGFTPVLDLDGDFSSYSETRMEELKQDDLKNTSMKLPNDEDSIYLLRTAVDNGKPIRAKGKWIHVPITSAKTCGYGINKKNKSGNSVFRNKNAFDVVYVMRPDIIELINISEKPIALKNWRVVINTGSYADQVGLIDKALHYNKSRNRQYDDPNPTIDPQGYFYLTNKREIFAAEYGNSDNGDWGTSQNQVYPCFELPDNLWGVRYKITYISGGKNNMLKVEGAKWKKDQMKGEMVEFQTERSTPNDRNGLFGTRKSVHGSGNNWLEFGSLGLSANDIRIGDTALIVGMPREGGFLSMTLKNQYNQIVARTVDYGSVDVEELNSSTEKVDPTHYSWVTTKNPTFGGNKKSARNHSYPTDPEKCPHIKNNRLSSVAEIQKVRTSKDWESIGTKSENSALKALGKYFSVSGVRLDPEAQNSHVSGWRPAYGTVSHGKAGSVVLSGANWEPGIWKGQTLRVISGDMKGESFAIADNTENSVKIEGYSIPSGKTLRVRKGDIVSVGPGYSTSMFYTRKDNDNGIWEWKNKPLEKMNYGLYIYGLNDSIDTTEFLEENLNAEMEVAVYNYKTASFDSLPLQNKKAKSGSIRDIYKLNSGSSRRQYEKNDGTYCGQIHPEHISSEHGVKLRVTSHRLKRKGCSGVAWFDYAYLIPERVHGKININTASERVLSSINGISQKTAQNIYYGIDLHGKKKLKPYKKITDVLDVNGVTPEMFGKICNLITTRSDQFRVRIIAEAIQDKNHDGKFNSKEGDKIVAYSEINRIIDRSQLTDDNPETQAFLFLR